MTPSTINVQLSLGSALPSPAPAFIAEKLESVEVTRKDNAPGGFQLVFHADRTLGLSQDFDLLSSPLLKPHTRAIIAVTINNTPTVLMDGFITQQELAHSRQFGASTLTVTGEDVSVLMDRVEFSLEYPSMGDGVIALAVLAKYSAVALPEVIPTPSDIIPLAIERTPQQNATDRCYLRQLASPYGYIFHVRPTSVPGMNKAYWGPPPRIGAVSPALTLDQGPATNVESLNFQFDALAPELVYGMVQDNITEIDAPLATLTSTRLPPFATNPALDLTSLFQARKLFTDPRLGYLQALVEAQAQTDVSTDQVVSAKGELDTIRYGAVLDTPGLVDVRGAGQSYDGRYYIPAVTHSIRRGAYKQSFTLTREGVGSTVSSVTP